MCNVCCYTCAVDKFFQVYMAMTASALYVLLICTHLLCTLTDHQTLDSVVIARLFVAFLDGDRVHPTFLQN